MLRPVHPLIRCMAVVALAGTGLSQPQVPMVELPSVHTLPRPPSRVPIYYPPAPPDPGSGIDAIPLLLEPNWDAPVELSHYVGELFYPVVGSRLAERDVSRRLRLRLEAHVERRQALVSGLREALAVGAELPPDHAEAVRQLETDAEELRMALLNDNYHWNTYRIWRVGPERTEGSEALVKVREFHLLRAAPFFWPRLSTGQRWLIWDYVLQLQAAGDDGVVAEPVVRPGGTMYFLPAGAQLRLPWALPEDLLQELQAFAVARLGMQRELAATLVEADSESGYVQEKRIKELSRLHEEVLAGLERQAEEIRTKLAALPPEKQLVLPAELAERARSYLANRESYESARADHLRQVRGEILQYRNGSEQLMWHANFASGTLVPVTSLGPGLQLQARVIESPVQQGRADRARERLDRAVQEFAVTGAERRLAIEAEGRALFEAALRVVSPETQVEGPVPAELARRTLAILAINETNIRLPRYGEYLTAVARPGLAPEQRRLLFGAALRDLNLPLPAGVRRPVEDMNAP